MKWFKIQYLRLFAFIGFFLIIGNLFSQVFFIATNSNFKDLLPEGQSQVDFENNALKRVLIEGMAESIYYVVNDSSRLIGFNEATGDTMQFNYNNYHEYVFSIKDLSIIQKFLIILPPIQKIRNTILNMTPYQ